MFWYVKGMNSCFSPFEKKMWKINFGTKELIRQSNFIKLIEQQLSIANVSILQMATIAANNSMVKTDFSDVCGTHIHTLKHIWPASVPQLDARSTDDQEVAVRDWSWNIFYGHSLHSADSRRAVSVSGKRMCTILVNCLEDYACSKRVVK